MIFRSISSNRLLGEISLVPRLYTINMRFASVTYCLFILLFILHVRPEFDFLKNMEMFKNEQYLCPEGQAVANFSRKEQHFRDRVDFVYNVNCTNISVCNESCEWSNQCTVPKYGKNVFIGGLLSSYNTMMRKRYLLFLCCNGTSNTSTPTCSMGPLVTSEEFTIKSTQDTVIREASTDIGAHNQFFLTTEFCTLPKTDVFTECPPSLYRDDYRIPAGGLILTRSCAGENCPCGCVPPPDGQHCVSCPSGCTQEGFLCDPFYNECHELPMGSCSHIP